MVLGVSMEWLVLQILFIYSLKKGKNILSSFFDFTSETDMEKKQRYKSHI